MYGAALSDIYGVIASAEWQAESIAVFPSDYAGNITDHDEYVLVTIMPAQSERQSYGGPKTIFGMVAFKIFTKKGFGQERMMEISDVLDTHFQNQTLTNIELGVSYLTYEGQDPADKSLISATYYIAFKLYGE